MFIRRRVAASAAVLAVVCCALSGCSQAGTSDEAGAAGQAASSAGSGQNGAGTSATPSAGSTSVSGSNAGGVGTQGGSTNTAGSSNAGSAGSSSAGGAGGTGGLFGGNEGKFPTLDLPLSLPEAAAAAPCPAGSVIQKVGSPTLYSWPGTVFGSAALSGQGENHAPTKLQVQVTNGAAQVAGCEVRFRAAADNGWGSAASKLTDQQGNLYGYWTAGKAGTNAISAVIALEGGGESKVDFTGTVTEHESRTDSVHLYYDVDSSYTDFKIRITPLSAPAATYYSALNWQDSYAGIQFDGNTTTVIFSVWDAGGQEAQITDQGACNAQVGFGGEGTGTSCRLKLPPSKNGAIAGLPDDYQLQAGDTYELSLSMASAGSGTAHSLTFTDLTRGIGPISLGTQTTGTAFEGGGHASGFVEEWTPHGSCLSNSRAVLYHGLRAKVGGTWQSVKSASFNPNYINTNNEICGNYLATAVDDTFLMSSGGSQYVGRPYVPGDNAFKKPLTTITLP